MKQAISFLLKKHGLLCLLIIVFCIAVSSCKKDSFITSTDARLSTSVDSLKYDTVFTSVGTITQSFKISNLNDQMLLAGVKLMGGAGSSFTININGIAASEIPAIEIPAEDSIYVFVSVHINPNAADLPFIVKDSIQISYNGNKQFVQLEAFGQNANFLRNRIITGNITWPNNLPYVILGSLVVDTGASLTIAPGCRVYAHADAPVIVDGSLVVNGSKSERVLFTGDRLDEDYKDYPASWPGIYFRGSSIDNRLRYVTVKNAYQALVAEQESSNGNTKLVLQQCIIDNAYDAGIFAVNSSIDAENCLVSNCGSNVRLIYGGRYRMTHCTVASYPSFISHKNPVLAVSNAASQDGTTYTADLDAVFRNCIFWGDSGFVDNEVMVGKQGANNFEVSFDHCLYRAVEDPASSQMTGSIKNQPPLFDSIDVNKRYFDFHTNRSTAAPGLNQGVATDVRVDLDGNTRNINLPDLGCYEKQ